MLNAVWEPLLTELVNKSVVVNFGEVSEISILKEVRKKKVTGWALVPEKRIDQTGKNRTPTCIEIIFEDFILTFVEEDFEVTVTNGGIKFFVGSELKCVLSPTPQN